MYCSTKFPKKSKHIDKISLKRTLKSEISFDELWRVITSPQATEIAEISPPDLNYYRFDFDKFHYICKEIYRHLNISWPFGTTMSFNDMLRIYRDEYQPQSEEDVFTRPYIDSTHKYIYINITSNLISEYNENIKQKSLAGKIKNKESAVSLLKQKFDNLRDPCDIDNNLFNINITRDKNFTEVCDILTGMYNDKLPEKSTTIIRSNMGTGKTVSSIKFITNPMFKDSVVIIIIPRKKLGLKQLGELAEQGFYYYENIKDYYINLEKYKKIIIQVDSVARLWGRFKDKNFQYIIYIDEVESVRSHLSNSLYLKEKGGDCSCRLRDLVKFSTHCIIMDANLSAGTFGLITDYCGRNEYFLYNNSTIREERKLYMLGGPNDIVKRLCADLKQGKKLFVPINSLTTAEEMIKEIERYIENENLDVAIQLFDAKNNELPEDPTLDPVNVFGKYDLVIATPAWQCGNSFVKSHFDRIYAYASASSSDPDEFSQLMHRCRIISAKECFLYVDNRVIGYGKILNLPYENLNQFLNDLEKKDIMDATHPYILAGGKVTNLRFGGIYYDKSNVVTYLSSVNEFYRNKYLSDYKERLLSILKYMGYELVDDLTDISEEACKGEKDFNKNKRITKENQKFKDIERLIPATTLSEDEMDNIKVRMDHIKNGKQIKFETYDVKTIECEDENGKTVKMETFEKKEIFVNPEPITEEEKANYEKTKLLDGVNLLPSVENIPQKLLEVKETKPIRRRLTTLMPIFQDFNPLSRLKTKRNNLLMVRNEIAVEYFSIVKGFEIYTDQLNSLTKEMKFNIGRGNIYSNCHLLVEDDYEEIEQKLIEYEKLYESKKLKLIEVDKEIDALEKEIEQYPNKNILVETEKMETDCVHYIMSKIFCSPMDPMNIGNYKEKFDASQKSIGKLTMIITLLRLLGFTNGFFHTTTIPVNRERVMEYLENEGIKSQISKYIDKPIYDDTPGLCSSRFIRFFNDNFLKEYRTKIETVEKKFYKLQTSWQIIVENNKAKIVQSGIDSRFSNSIYEEEIYGYIMPNLHNFVDQTPITERGYVFDDIYCAHKIVNIHEWNNFLIANQKDMPLMMKMKKIFNESTALYIQEKNSKRGFKTTYDSILERYEKKINYRDRQSYI